MKVKLPAPLGYCACGRPLHYLNTVARLSVDALIREAGEHVVVTVGLKHWLVQRHFIALHGLKAVDLQKLGFPEIGPDEVVVRADAYIPPE